MSNFKGINGTPWHIEAIGMDEDDERRHRSRCEYFQKESVFCHKRKGKCIGSAHCDYYKEKPREVEPAHKDIGLRPYNGVKLKIK